METAIDINWDTVRMTSAAQNTKKPDDRRRVVVVPRAVFDAWWPKPWAEVQAAAFAGTDGLSPLVIMSIDRPQSDCAFVREGRAERSLKGRTLLFVQGW